MRIPRLSVLLAVLVLSLASAAQLHAQAAPSFQGTFVRDAAAGDDMDVVIQNALPKIKSTLGRIFKGAARKRLMEVNRPYAWIRFTPEGNMVTVESESWKVTTPRNGTLAEWPRRGADGKTEKIRVTTETQGSTMTQRFQAEDGTRTNVYSLSPDGRTLTVNVTVTSEKLTGPVTYKLVYRRR